MAIVELVMPKMGESVAEATIINWLKSVGDAVVEDDIILEVATDKVDSEIPSTVSGTLIKILHEVDAVVAVGEVLALIETEGEHVSPKVPTTVAEPIVPVKPIEPSEPQPTVHTPQPVAPTRTLQSIDPHRFYAPAVRYTAISHGLSRADLDTINGSGPNGRVTQEDVLTHIKSAQPKSQSTSAVRPTAQVSSQNHTTSIFVEMDITRCQLWARKHDHAVNAIVLDGVIKALQDHPQLNGGTQNGVNIALGATAHDALMPVLEQAEAYNLSGLMAQLASDALSTEADSSFSISNTAADTVSNIVTPQLYRDHRAALSLGQIIKKPVIQETPEGDIIAIRHMMYVSLSYDHRSVDGSTADAFLNRLTHYIESFDADRSI